MHDLNGHDTTTTPQRPLRGIAFEVAELLLIKSWADARNIQTVVRLNHTTDNEEYEVVIIFYPEANASAPLIMWRTERFVCVLPVIGARRRYRTVAKALESPTMDKIPSTILTDR